MQVGDYVVEWGLPDLSAKDLLTAIQIVCFLNVKRVDGDNFSVYRIVDSVRVDLKPEFFADSHE